MQRTGGWPMKRSLTLVSQDIEPVGLTLLKNLGSPLGIQMPWKMQGQN